MNKVMGIKISLVQIMNSDAPNAASKDFVTPKKATVLSGNYGTLIEAEEGGYFLVPIGIWFRSSFYGKSLPQVDDFDKLQDLGLTLIKDKIIRNDSKPTVVEKQSGQEIRVKNNSSVAKINKAVPSNTESEEKD
jgi:hypothetical protein